MGLSEDALRREIVEAGRRLYENGLVCATDGNLSARLSDREILVTPSGVCKGHMTEDMLSKFDIDGNLLEHTLAPSSEAKLHLAIYRRNPKIRAVCHAHPLVASTFAAANVALDQMFLLESVMFLGVIPVAPYAPPGSIELAEGAAQYALEYNGALLEHHGAVAWGDSVTQALHHMERIEHTANVMMYSKMMGFTRTLNKEANT